MNSGSVNPEKVDVISELPGFQFIDHVAVSVLPGELEGQVQAYRMMGFQEIHLSLIHI